MDVHLFVRARGVKKIIMKELWRLLNEIPGKNVLRLSEIIERLWNELSVEFRNEPNNECKNFCLNFNDVRFSI